MYKNYIYRHKEKERKRERERERGIHTLVKEQGKVTET